MTKTNRPTSQALTSASSGPQRAAPASARWPSAQLIFEGVVAGYIHELSEHHRQARLLSDTPDGKN
jgi:hypothetical protein